MPNFMYTKAKEKLLSGAINLATDSLRVALVKEGYAANESAHEFLTDLGANRISSDQALTGQSIAGGAFDASDPTFPAVAAGDVAGAVVIYKHTGVAGTSPLLFYFDVIGGFPLTTNGGNVSPEWDNGPKKIYKL